MRCTLFKWTFWFCIIGLIFSSTVVWLLRSHILDCQAVELCMKVVRSRRLVGMNNLSRFDLNRSNNTSCFFTAYTLNSFKWDLIVFLSKRSLFGSMPVFIVKKALFERSSMWNTVLKMICNLNFPKVILSIGFVDWCYRYLYVISSRNVVDSWPFCYRLLLLLLYSYIKSNMYYC